MTRKATTFASAVLVCTSPALAQTETRRPSHAVGMDVTFSTDADDTSVLRAGANFDLRYRNGNDYLGMRLERVAYQPSGQARSTDRRVFIRAADMVGVWTYHAAIGTDGDALLGNASINDAAPVRKEFFIERDKVETPLGIANPIFHTFGGATIDLPVGRSTQLTLLGGLQKFTGENLRTHVRANLIQVLKEDWGLSAQLRSRYFRNSRPLEYDYFSPPWYAEIVPVMQVRRFVGGWHYLAAGGWGMQRDSRSNWRQSRYANLRMISPADRRGWIVNAEATYSNTPITNSKAYDYARIGLALARAF